MSPIVKPRCLYLPALCVALLTLTGCGVAAYEKQMQEAETRIQRIDEENRLLGAPLEVPSPPPKTPSLTFFFLRPPLGVATVSKNDEIPYHYPATSGVCSDVYLTFGADQDATQKVIEEKLGTAGLNWQPVTVTPWGRAPIAFKAVEFFDAQAPANAPAVFAAYVHQTAGFPGVGVVFRVLKSSREAAAASLKMSMETYAEQGEAFKARNEFNKRTTK